MHRPPPQPPTPPARAGALTGVVLLLVLLIPPGCRTLDGQAPQAIDPDAMGLIPLTGEPGWQPDGPVALVRLDGAGRVVATDDLPGLRESGVLTPPPELLPVGTPLAGHRIELRDWCSGQGVGRLALVRVERDPDTLEQAAGFIGSWRSLLVRIDPWLTRWVPLLAGFHTMLRHGSWLTAWLLARDSEEAREEQGYAGLAIGLAAGGLLGTLYPFVFGDGLEDDSIHYASIIGAVGGGAAGIVLGYGSVWLFLLPPLALLDALQASGLLLVDGGNLLWRGLLDGLVWMGLAALDGCRFLGAALVDGLWAMALALHSWALRPLLDRLPWPWSCRQRVVLSWLDPVTLTARASWQREGQLATWSPAAWRDQEALEAELTGALLPMLLEAQSPIPASSSSR